MNPSISVVIPVYGCGGCLRELYNRIQQTVEVISPSFEIIMVNDGGSDQSWQMIQILARQDARVKGIALSRNFGQHFAITAGLDYSTGAWVVVMDCDLQDQPEEIQSLYDKVQEGYDIVFARRAKRKDTMGKRIQSKLFYKIYDYFTENNTDASIANFTICSRAVVDQFCLLREKSRSYPLFLKWLGFKWAVIDVKHAGRREGRSSYNWSKLINFAIDSLVSQSNKPLRFSIIFGFIIAFFSMICGLFLIYKYFFLYQPVAGWTSVMVSLYFLGGLIFVNLGVMGLYIGKIFDEAKDRPLYVVRAKVGFDPIYSSLLTTHEKKR